MATRTSLDMQDPTDGARNIVGTNPTAGLSGASLHKGEKMKTPKKTVFSTGSQSQEPRGEPVKTPKKTLFSPGLSQDQESSSHTPPARRGGERSTHGTQKMIANDARHDSGNMYGSHRDQEDEARSPSRKKQCQEDMRHTAHLLKLNNDSN